MYLHILAFNTRVFSVFNKYLGDSEDSYSLTLTCLAFCVGVPIVR